VALNLVVWGDPVPQGSKRAFIVQGKDGRPRPVVAESAGASLRQWRSDVVDAAREALGGRGPLQGPLSVEACFWLRPPKHKPPRYPYRRPDLDKLTRALLDALTTAGVMADDAQVVTLRVSKRYASTPSVEVTVEEMT